MRIYIYAMNMIKLLVDNFIKSVHHQFMAVSLYRPHTDGLSLFSWNLLYLPRTTYFVSLYN